MVNNGYDGVFERRGANVEAGDMRTVDLGDKENCIESENWTRENQNQPCRKKIHNNLHPIRPLSSFYAVHMPHNQHKLQHWVPQLPSLLRE